MNFNKQTTEAYKYVKDCHEVGFFAEWVQYDDIENIVLTLKEDYEEVDGDGVDWMAIVETLAEEDAEAYEAQEEQEEDEDEQEDDN